jgi:type IV pilus assembly protein PilY1
MEQVMKLVILGAMAIGSSVALTPGRALALPDRTKGDTDIYVANPATAPRPNVLIIFDNNAGMGASATTGSSYDPLTVYPGPYTNDTVYKNVTTNQNTNYVAMMDRSAVTCTEALDSLNAYGTWTASSGSGLKNSGTCGNGGSNIIYLGNLLNYNAAPSAGTTNSQVEIVRDAVISAVGSSLNAVNYGFLVFGSNKAGGRIIKPVADLSPVNSTAYKNFVEALPPGPAPGTDLLSGNGRPLAEALYDAGVYFQGNYSNAAFTITNQNGPYGSPITADCQLSFVIVITNGDTDGDANPKLGAVIGDRDGDGLEPGAYGSGTHYLDDVAKYLYDTDLSPLSGTQRVVTHAIQVFSPFKDLVSRATNNQHGHGSYLLAASANELSQALLTVIANIVLETDTAFVAPVVPVSPDNRTYSGSRVYLGFFKPISKNAFWHGNLKKFGIDSTGAVVDKNGAAATNADGSFKAGAISYWTTIADGGSVENGGTGEVLAKRNLTTSPRALYTYNDTAADANLTATANAFTTSNGWLAPGKLGVLTSTEKDQIINFVHGRDAYDEDADTDTTETRATSTTEAWILGDILHSKPVIVNYQTYPFTPTNESDCLLNKSLIFVGANDGMLHAFRDCDGSEAWGFVPPDGLRNLQYLSSQTHMYFVDGSPSIYTYDADKDGVIETGDRVILLVGERRGGGQDVAPATGFYYALDVTDPVAPRYLWRISNADAAYTELGETWSDPQITTIKIGTSTKIVAVIGAGYDNLGEDARSGAVQVSADLKGRGIYVVEIATLDGSGVPVFTGSGTKVWGYTNGATTTTTTHADMDYSIPSSVAVVDTDSNGYADRLYVGDAGGNMWRFDIGDTITANWTGRHIFSANPGSGGATDVGRKIFYRPSVVPESGYTMLLFGSGDREHPLNTGLVDRIYAVKDRGQTSPKHESDMVDVTTDTLQVSTDSALIASTLAALDSQDGWYIKLDVNSGEKVLAPALTFFSAYFTTYSPNIVASPDPCAPGNLGTGRIYVLNYKTGEAVVDYDSSNNGISTTNTRAMNASGQVLLRSDRVQTLGSGIPSGVVPIIQPGGEASILVGCGGGLCTPPSTSADTVVPLYWRRVM